MLYLSKISTVDYINIIMTESSEMIVWRSGPLPVIQTSETKSVTDSEIISLDARLHREITATNTKSKHSFTGSVLETQCKTTDSLYTVCGCSEALVLHIFKSVDKEKLVLCFQAVANVFVLYSSLCVEAKLQTPQNIWARLCLLNTSGLQVMGKREKKGYMNTGNKLQGAAFTVDVQFITWSLLLRYK